jgi:hypothetical protein
MNTIPFEISGSTKFSSVGQISFNDSALSCSYVPQSARGDWYTLIGQGTCLSASRWSQMSSVIAVYKGIDCQSISCVAQQSYGQQPFEDSSVKWLAEEGQQYWILLSGGSIYDSGEYSLTITVSVGCLFLLSFDRAFFVLCTIWCFSI